MPFGLSFFPAYNGAKTIKIDQHSESQSARMSEIKNGGLGLYGKV